MNRTRRSLSIAAALVAVAAVGPANSSASALPTTQISVGGTTNDGFYFPDTLTKRLGESQILFSMQPDSGAHNVFLDPARSTKGVSFPNLRAPIEITFGETFNWPSTLLGEARPWKPSKPGTYFLYCTKHPGSGGSKHIGGMVMTVNITKLITAAAPVSKRVKAGSKAVKLNVSADAATTSSVAVVQCLNKSCSKARKISSKAFSLRKGKNSLKLATKSLAKGNYQLRVTAAGNTSSSPFSVK